MQLSSGFTSFELNSQHRSFGFATQKAYRRALWLVVFELLHAYFIWIGDILYFYGVAGLMLFPLRKLRPSALLAAGALLLMIFCGITTLTHYSLIRTRDQALAVIVWSRRKGSRPKSRA
jgi:uncharacterized protein